MRVLGKKIDVDDAESEVTPDAVSMPLKDRYNAGNLRKSC
jgi:hypothetical protein